MSQIMTSVFEKCLELDVVACRLYSSFITKFENEGDVSDFWKNMYLEETGHVKYWTKLLELSKKGYFDKIFENEVQMLDEVQEIVDSVNLLAKTEISTLSNALIVAIKLEFLAVNTIFEQFFQYVNLFPTELKNVNYDAHIDGFLKGFNKYIKGHSEYEILGRALEKLMKQNKQLVHSSKSDLLSGVLNRRGFYETLTPVAHMNHRQKTEVAVMMIDIDDFKKVNDIHGHQKGDEVISFLGKSIGEFVRRSDIVGRYGGEEFIVFFSDVEKESLLMLAEKLRSYIESSDVSGIDFTVSIGVSHGFFDSDPLAEFDKMVGVADSSLYKAKSLGKNIVVIDSVSFVNIK